MAVITVTFNSARVVTGLIESLGRGLEGLSWKLIVVDNASTDDTCQMIERAAPLATLIDAGRNGGYAAGINLGVQSAGAARAVLIVNPDVRLDPGCGIEMYRHVDSNGVGIATPWLRDARGHLILSIRRIPTVSRAWGEALLGANRAGKFARLGEVESRPNRYTRCQIVDWAEGSTMMVTAECLAACGKWDESFFLYSEETEYMIRARNLGFATIFVPTAKATHLEGGYPKPSMWSLLVVNKVRLFSRGHGRTSSAAFWSAHVFREGTRSLLGRPSSRRAVRDLLATGPVPGTAMSDLG